LIIDILIFVLQEQIRRWKEWEAANSEDKKKEPFKPVKPGRFKGDDHFQIITIFKLWKDNYLLRRRFIQTGFSVIFVSCSFMLKCKQGFFIQ